MIHPDYKPYAETLKTKDMSFVHELQKASKHQMEFYNKMMSEKEMNESKLYRARGNLLDLAEEGEFDIVVQGCNCFNTMGGGIAREIAEKYPSAARVDRSTPYGDIRKLGTWTEFNIGRFHIINAYTQYNMSTGEDVFEYNAFALILQKLAHEYPNKRFGFPFIGMGLAGGDKERIIPMLKEFANKIDATGGRVTMVEFVK